MITSLNALEKKLLDHKELKKLVLAAGEDIYALGAVIDASIKGFITPIIVGDSSIIHDLAKSTGLSLNGIEIIHEDNQQLAVEKAVKLVHDGSADILMKGASSTAVLLKAVLNKEWGLRKGNLLSHISVFEIPKYHKLLSITDVAINIAPDIKAKISILENAVAFLNRIGILIPKVALIAAVEKVYDSMQATLDADEIVKIHSEGFITNCIIDGPFALDIAVDAESASHKGIKSKVAGDADLLLMPQIESGNVLYKALSFLMETKVAAVVLGASAPIVLTSRADSHESKLNSIVLAALGSVNVS